MKHEYLLVFTNTETGKAMILERYTSNKKAQQRADEWNRASKEVKVTVTKK